MHATVPTEQSDIAFAVLDTCSILSDDEIVDAAKGFAIPWSTGRPAEADQGAYR
jgi:hypothetical protein